MEIELTMTKEDVEKAVRAWVSEHVIKGLDNFAIVKVEVEKYKSPCGYTFTLNKSGAALPKVD